MSAREGVAVPVTSEKFIAICSLLLLAWLWLYFPALASMEAIWRRSDTFAHGYFILPITLWLIWRDKTYLLSSYATISWRALPFLFGALVMGLFAYSADINVLAQLSAVAALVSLSWLLLGDHLAWRYKFPLAFLFFSVPMGENLIPWLQDVTAWFTVTFLKIHGIPVFRDGLYIQIPDGLFEVAVACSGIRYLIASIAVGALYAYLSYRSIFKQLAFILFAATLPIVANGLRAYGIVIIAHYSDMEYATGADHLIYGWVFFGFVIMLMFYIGGKFADDETASTVNNSPQLAPTRQSAITIVMALSLLLLASYWLASLKVSIPPKQPLPAFKVSSEYQPSNHSTWGITYRGGLERSHVINIDNVEFFRAVYANKQTTGEMISFDNKLYDHQRWTIVAQKQVSVASAPANIVHLRSIQGKTRSYIYQFRVNNFYTVSSTQAKFMQAFENLFKRSQHSELVAASISLEQDQLTMEKQLIVALAQLSDMER